MKKFYIEYEKGTKSSYCYRMFASYADVIESMTQDPTIKLKTVVQIH